MADIYFSEAYGKLYETIQHGKLERFEYEDGNGKILHQFIKRPIDVDLEDGREYFDLITPYGYGGPVILFCPDNRRDALVNGFHRAFLAYCEEENIVSEYITFHPLENNAQDFESMYCPTFARKTLGTNLTYDDPITAEFSKDCRKKINKFIRQGVSYRITEKPDSLDAFVEIYYDTMQHNHAGSFYYFDRQYFSEILNMLKDRVVLIEALFEEKVIAAEIDLLSDDGEAIHGHLTGVWSEYRHLSPQYVMCYGITKWGKEHGYSVIHVGGGLSAEENDSLFLFKKKFSQKTEFDLYTAKKIWDETAYYKICKKLNIDCEQVRFFPAYRSKL